jgi:hypothetical protein
LAQSACFASATRTENTKKGHGWSMANDEFLKRKKNPGNLGS